LYNCTIFELKYYPSSEKLRFIHRYSP